MEDTTEEVRRRLVAEMPEELVARIQHGERVWDTDELRAEFDVQGFMAPFVMVRRKEDGREGTLMFCHAPRYYFDWRPADGR